MRFAHVAESLAKWTADVLATAPREVKERPQPTATLITDASDWGFGAIFVDQLGRLQAAGVPWSKKDREQGMTKKSVYAEPEGICRGLQQFVKPSFEGRIVVLKDNSAAVYALAKGHSPAFFVTAVCDRIRREFPKLELIMKHIPASSSHQTGYHGESN